MIRFIVRSVRGASRGASGSVPGGRFERIVGDRQGALEAMGLKDVFQYGTEPRSEPISGDKRGQKDVILRRSYIPAIHPGRGGGGFGTTLGRFWDDFGDRNWLAFTKKGGFREGTFRREVKEDLAQGAKKSKSPAEILLEKPRSTAASTLPG